ncbi:MAG TPA: ribonuclease H-like YkuK family protein [Limnochordia bacterium]|nr:ribonuclease H-like YkuK family protein [Limnochordia bacterium]
MEFISPTKGRLTFEQVFEDVMAFAAASPEDSYRLIVGTDSQIKDGTCFVTALIVHRKGKGARFYYTRSYEEHVRSLRQRIFFEASLSLSLASRLAERLAESGHEIDMEIHLDVGTNGATKSLVKEVVGMVNGSGFLCRIKPDSYGASAVADRYTK